MSQSLQQNLTSQYPKISFKKCILFNHQNTVAQLTFHASKQIMSNPTIKRCLDMHYKDERHKIFSFLAAVVFVKIGTKVVHMNRALALSAPRSWRSTLFKYVFVPYLLSTYKYVKDIKRTIMEIESQISEDPEADELWQPIFEKKYSNLNQQLYSSPFKKFKLEEILRDDSKAKAIL